MTETKQTSTTKTDRRPDCVTEIRMGNSVDVYKRQHEGDPIAIQAVLDRYAGYIRYFSKMNGYYNSDMEDYIRTKLIESLFKFRLDR